MPAPSLATLLIQHTKAQIYETALSICTLLGLPVTSWQAGDPTRAAFHHESEILESWEEIATRFVESGYLGYAKGVWLKIRAEQDFNVTVPEATYATTQIVLTNAGGGSYDEEDLAAGNLTFRNSSTGKTYHNTTTGSLGPVGSDTDELTLTIVADEAGSDSSAAVGEIDEMVTQLLGVTCTNPTTAIGVDEQDASVTVQQCRDKTGTFGPNGPKDAYSYVLKDPEKSGLSFVPRVRVYSDSDTGDVRIVVAGPNGAITADDRELCEEAVLTHCTPLCITPTVVSATNVVVPVTYELWVYKRCNKSEDEIKADVEAELLALLSSSDRPIGGDVIPPATDGALYKSLLESTIRGVFPGDAFRCVVTLPAGDTALDDDEVAALGTITATVHLVVDP